MREAKDDYAPHPLRIEGPCWRVLAMVLLFGSATYAQQAPSTLSRPWLASPAQARSNSSKNASEKNLDQGHVYTLPELVDLAEEHNPDTRIAWEAAKMRASDLRIARSELLPALVAVASANSTRQTILFGNEFIRQTVSCFEPFLSVDYTIFDFRARSSRIAEARDELLAANFAFNAVHLDIAFETSRRYYRLLNALGLQEAAQANLENAQTVLKAIEARESVGLATLPDVLEARSAAAQADYELQAAIGQSDITRGDLLSILGDRPLGNLKIQSLLQLQIPTQMNDEAEQAVERALVQRPEILERAAEERAAGQRVREARSAYFPTFDFHGTGGEQRLYGQQAQIPALYGGPTETWNATLTLHWNLFDGGRREAEFSHAHEEVRQAQAITLRAQDDVEQQVWNAYIDLRTAFRQREAATALLAAAQSSYDASVKSYDLGLRNVVDVVTAQRTLAQALSQDVTARAEVLVQLANLAYRTGDLLKSTQSRPRP